MTVSPGLCLGLGAAGLVLTAVTWMEKPFPISIGFAAALLICALGGALPVRLAWLDPMPLALPVVGAMALAWGPSEAMAAGLVGGLSTGLAPRFGAPGRSRAASPIESWVAAACIAGTMALAGGLASRGIARILVAESGLPGLLAEAVKWPAVMALAVWSAWCVTRIALREGILGSWRSARALLGSIAVTAAVLALLVAFARWGEGIVLACLASAGTTSTLWALRLRRQDRRVTRSQHRARTSMALVETIALAIEAKDRTSERHLRRVRTYAVGVGRRLGMSGEELEELGYAALLHDIGKLVVSESILSKPSRLSSEEFQTVSEHTTVGAEILQAAPLPPAVAAAVRHHHERYDGSGYPDGLIGMEIPLAARILAAVDTFDALISDRTHRRRMPVREAIAYLQRNAGTRFDPRVVRVLTENHREFEQLVVEEEKDGADTPPPSSRPADDARTLKVNPPYQVVLDRIASSHMEIYSLYEISQSLGKSLDLEESFRLVTGKIRRLIHFSSCAVYILDTGSGVLKARFATGDGADPIMGLTFPLGHKTSGWAALQRQPARLSSGSLEAGQARWDLESIAQHPQIARLKSALVAPLVVAETILGVIALYDTVDQEYTSQEEHLLTLIAGHVGGAIRAGILYEQTKERTLTDPLTGLPNTRYMFITFDREAEQARLRGTSLTLMIMNIDDFKGINDDFGRHAGDRFLVGMAKAIRSELRTCDTCIRYAGDEFVALLPGLAKEEVGEVVARMTAAARAYCMEGRPGRSVRLSLSVGHATLPDDGEDIEKLMAAAEERMGNHRSWNRQEPTAPVPIVFPARPS